MDSRAQPLNSTQRRPSLRRVVLPIGLILSLLLLIQFLRAAATLNRLTAEVAAVQAIMQDGSLAGLQSDRAGELDALLSQSVEDFRDLRATLVPWVYAGPLFGWVPRYGGDLANAPALLDFGEQVTTSARETLRLGQSFDAALEQARSGGATMGEVFLQTAHAQGDSIQRARGNLAAIARARSHIDAPRLSPSLQSMVNRFDELMPLWTTTIEGLALMPAILGEDRPRAYLLVAQNSDELRATGGLISSVALLRVDRGRFSVTDFQDSYAVDNLTKVHPIPPPALAKYMFAGMWVLRDANWSPDWPTAAYQIANIYQTDRGIAVDGVIAINLNMIERLVQAVGPVTVDASGESVDGGNVIQKMQEFWASPQGKGQTADWWEHRKDFLGRLLEAVVARLRSGSFDQTSFARKLYDAIAAKDVLIYLNDFNADREPTVPWDGALYKGRDGALMIVDSNVGFNKVSPNITRQAAYTVAIDAAGGVRATVAVTYTNHSAATGAPCVLRPYYPPTYAELQQGCYWNYVRLFVPSGSELVDATEGIDAVTESSVEGRTIFGGYFVLPRGESQTIRFEYRLPPLPRGASSYTMRLEKQPGAISSPISVRVTLPDTKRLRSANPRAGSSSDNTFEWEVELDRDQIIQVAFESNRLRPIDVIVGVMGVSLLVGGGWWFYRHRRR